MQQEVYSSDNISSGNIERIIQGTDDFGDVHHLSILVDDGIFDSRILVDDGIAADHGILDDRTLLDPDTAAHDGIDDRSFDDGAVCDIGIGHFAAALIKDRRRIIGAGEDRPVLLEQFGEDILVEKFEGILEIVAQGVELSHIAVDLLSFDKYACGSIFQDIRQIEEGGSVLSEFHKGQERIIGHDPGSQGDVSLIGIPFVGFQGHDSSSVSEDDLVGIDEVVPESGLVRIKKRDLVLKNQWFSVRFAISVL